MFLFSDTFGFGHVCSCVSLKLTVRSWYSNHPFLGANFQGNLPMVGLTSHKIQEWDEVPDGKPGTEADGFSPELGKLSPESTEAPANGGDTVDGNQKSGEKTS